MLTVVLTLGMGAVRTRAQISVPLDDAGQKQVDPKTDPNITGNFSVKLPVAGWQLKIMYIMEFEYDPDADSYRAKWKEFPDSLKKDSIYAAINYQWAANFFRDEYPEYAAPYTGPEKLAQAGTDRQTEVYTALQKKLWDWWGAVVGAAISAGRFDDMAITELWEWRTASTDVMTLTDQPLGQYLPVLNMGEFAPLTVTLLPEKNLDGVWILSDKRASFKFAAGQIAKSVDRDQVAVGDTVHFTVDTAVPDYTKLQQKNGELDVSIPEEKKVLHLEDVMSRAFALQQDTLTLTGKKADGDYEPIPQDCYTLSIKSDSATGGTRLAFKFDGANYTKLHEYGYTELRLEYDAVVTEKAAVGTDDNSNTARLTFVKNIDGKTENIEDTVTVWTYGVHVIKADGDTLDADGTAGDGTVYLPGANFVLYKREGTYPSKEDAGYQEAVKKYETEKLLYTLPIYQADGKTVKEYELYVESIDSITSTADGSRMTGILP